MLLVLCLVVWRELVACLDVCGFVKLLNLSGSTMLLGLVILWDICYVYGDEACWRGSIKYLG